MLNGGFGPRETSKNKNFIAFSYSKLGITMAEGRLRTAGQLVGCPEESPSTREKNKNDRDRTTTCVLFHVRLWKVIPAVKTLMNSQCT